ncbi:MAG: hypothetical protein LBH43_03895 [Treponema sp.]|jgi:hypothetical protein|nr:hypothetical protein [Treponema sp.]
MKEISSKSVFYTVFGIFPALLLVALVFDACLQPIDPQDFINAMTGFDANIRTTDDLVEAIAGQATGNLKYGNEWILANGTYRAQLDIYTDITVRGQSRGGVIITGPANYQSGTDKLNGISTTNIYQYGKPSLLFGLVTIHDGCSVEIKDLTVQGNMNQCSSFMTNYDGNTRPELELLCGIGIVDAEVTLDNLVITGIRAPAPKGYMGRGNGFGIIAAGDTDLTVNKCVIKDFTKYGAYFMADVKDLIFTNNTVTGMGNTICGSEKIGPYGTTAPSSWDTGWAIGSAWPNEWMNGSSKTWPTDWLFAQNGIGLDCPSAEIKGNRFEWLINASGFNSIAPIHNRHDESAGILCWWLSITSPPLPSYTITGNTFYRCDVGIGVGLNSSLSSLETDYPDAFGSSPPNTFTGSLHQNVFVQW